MIKGIHGSTYGGNPLAISVGKKVIEIILERGFLHKVDKIARYLWKKLKLLEKKYDQIIEIRGAGLLLGMKTKLNNLHINQLLANNGLLCVPASDNIIRFTPSLIVTESEVNEAIHIIEKTLNDLND